MTTYPTADDIAKIIVAAFRRVGADPLAVADGGNHSETRQGRVYAAMAINAAFPAFPTGKIGHVVGYPHAPYFGIMDTKIRKGKFRWYDPDVLAEIMAAAGFERGERPPQREVIEPERQTKPFSGARGVDMPPERRKLEMDLHEALTNTARMQR